MKIVVIVWRYITKYFATANRGTILRSYFYLYAVLHKTNNYHPLNKNSKHYCCMVLYIGTVFRPPCHLLHHLITSTKVTVSIFNCDHRYYHCHAAHNTNTLPQNNTYTNTCVLNTLPLLFLHYIYLFLHIVLHTCCCAWPSRWNQQSNSPNE